MALGYESYAKIDSTLLLCTAASVPRTRPILESSSGYGGTLSDFASPGMGLPKKYDWENVAGSIDYELYLDDSTDPAGTGMFDLFRGFLSSRQTSFAVTVQTRSGGLEEFNECYWNSLTLTGAEGQLITGNIGFSPIKRNTHTIGGAYVSNRLGSQSVGTDMRQFTVIPFWKSQILTKNPLSWELTFSQDVVNFFGCTVNSSPIAPAFVGLGPLTGQLSFEVLPDAGIDPISTIYTAVPSLTLVIDGYKLLRVAQLELQEDNDSIAGLDALASINLTYNVYDLEFPAL